MNLIEDNFPEVRAEPPPVGFDVSLTTNLVLSVITTIAGFVSGTVIVMVLGNILPVAVFGEVVYAFTFASLVQIIISYGFPLMVVRDISQQRLSPPKAVVNILVAQVLLTIITIFGLGILIALNLLPSKLLPVLSAFAVFGILGGFITVMSAINKGLNDFAVEAKVAVIKSLSLGILILAAFAILPRTAMTVGWAAIVSNVLGTIFALLLVRPLVRMEPGLHPNRIIIRDLLRAGFPFALQLVFGTLYFQVDTLIVGKLLDMEAVGFYQAAVRLVMAALSVAMIINGVFFPRLARAYNHITRSFTSSDPQKMIGALVVMGISSTIIFVFSSKLIISTVYGSKMLPSVPILRIFTLVLLFRFVASGYGVLLIASHRQLVTVWVAGIATLVNIVLNLVLVPLYGIVSSAWINVLTNFLILLIYLIKYYKNPTKGIQKMTESKAIY